MPRSGSGVYTLPNVNPVVGGTSIVTSWANPTMSDIAAALTDSLSRSGQGGMLAPFKVQDGTLAAPGLAFLNEPGLGLYREGAALAHFVVANTKVMTLKPSEAEFPNYATFLKDQRFKLTGQKSYIIKNDAGALIFAPSTQLNGDAPDLALATSLNAAGTLDVYALKVKASGIEFSDGSVQTSAAGIKGVTRDVITIASGATTGTFTLIPAVVAAKSEMRYLGTRAGTTADFTSGIVNAFAYLTLSTNGATITATRFNGAQPSACEVSWELTEHN